MNARFCYQVFVRGMIELMSDGQLPPPSPRVVPSRTRQRDAMKLLCEVGVVRMIEETMVPDGVDLPSDSLPGFRGNSYDFEAILRSRSQRLRMSHYTAELNRFFDRLDLVSEVGVQQRTFNFLVDLLADATRSLDTKGHKDPRLSGIAVELRGFIVFSFRSVLKPSFHAKHLAHFEKFDPSPLFTPSLEL